MTTKTAKSHKAAKGPRKGTIMETIIRILGRETVPPDASIVEAVRSAHKGTKFNAAHLAWYKAKYRVGELTGMTEGHHTIAQKLAPKKSTAPAKKALPKKAAPTD